MWTAASDQDYDLETGNADRWEREDVEDVLATIEANTAELDADPEYHAWLERVGNFDPIDESAFDRLPVYDDTLGRREHVGGFSSISRR